MSKDNLSSLYNGLIKKGYSSDDIGDEATFRRKMADKENRKALYDYVSSRGDFRIGDYESYESRLSGKPEQEKPDIDVLAATAEQTAVPDETTVQDALPREQRKTLREQVGTGIPFAVPSESEMAAKFATVPTDDVNARLQKAAASGKLDTIINSEEEKNISQVFTPRPIFDVSDIYKNFSDRFSLTERGKELNAELADISKDIQGKYMQEFMASDEFKKLQNSLKGQELDDAANEAFRSMYSAKIDSELRPYVKAFQDEAFARYETDLSRDLSAYQEKEKQKTKESIASDVSSLSASVNNLLDDNHRRLSSHAGSGGSAMSAIMGSRKYIQETEQDRKSKSQLEAAQKLLEESQNIIDEAGKKGKTNFIAGLGRGFADTAFNADNWLFGLPDIRDSKVLMDTLDKYDKGEALTESEQALMDAAVANMATNAYYYSDLGRGYKAGSVTGQSIPFMLEFAINPVSGSGSAIAKSILKYGMKKFGKSAVKNSAAKFAARLVGDAAAAAAMTGTSSLARVAAGAIERAGGDIQLDETGTGYAGRTGQMGAGEALGKSFASTFLNNQSEMVLNAFSGLGSKIWKSAEKYIPGGAAAIMDNAVMGKAGEIYRKIKSDPTFKEVARRTQFHGISKEYLEELYDNFANIPLGEMTLEEATDLDNNIDTFLGLAPTSVAFGVIGLGGLTAQKMQHRKKMKAAFGNMSRIERERLAKLEELGEKAGNEDIKNFIRETILDKDLSPEEKKAEIEYAYNLAVGNAIDDVEAAQQDEIQQSSLNASQEGAAIYAEHNPETMRQTVLRRELAEQKLIDAGFAAEDIERMKSTPVGERGQLLSSMDEASSQPATDFFNAFDREEAMNEALDTAHEEEVSQARSMLQDIVLPNQTVTVIPLGQYGNEQAQYGVVVSGIDANGNPTQNNGAVVTYPVQVVNGSPDFSTIDKGNAVVAIPASYTDAMVFSPDDAFNGMLSAYQQDAAILEGTPIFQGAQFPVMFDDGSMQNIIVAGTAPTGESVIVLPDGKTVNMSMEELSMRKRNAELAPIMAEQAEEEQVQQQAVQEAVTAGYSEEVKNLQPQAGEKLVIDGRNAAIKEVAPDGLIVDYISENGDIMGTDVVPYEAYYDYKQTLFEQQNELTQQQTTGENVSGQPGETGAPDSTVSTTEGEAAEVTGIQQEAGYPMDENGEPDFLRMQPKQTVQLLANTFAEDAASFVSDRLSAAQKAAEKAAKKSPKALGFNERVKELSEIKQERESAAREIEYWQNISSLIGTEVQPQQVAQAPTIMEEAEDESRRNQERLASMTEEEIAAAQAKVQENIDKGKYESRSAGRKRIRYSEQDSEMGEAFTPMEHVLREIATGRIVFQWSDKGSTQGLGSHLGMSDSNKERQSLIWALSNEGYTPEAAAEIIHGDMSAAMQELVTDQDVFNMILDAFSQYGSPSRMFEAAQQMHGNDLESQKGYEEDMERQQLEWEAYYNNMSVEDWSIFVDIIEEELEYQLRTFTDEDINAIFEEIYNEQYGTGRIETESTEGAQQSADSEGSNEIQPQQESDNETADGRSEVRPEETAASDEQGGSTLSQPGFTVEKRYHKKDKKDIFAVNFTERMERAAFLDAKKKAKDAGGYYSSFGKGGFIFETEEEARNFAESILPLPKQSSIEAARAEVEQNPTEAQKEAGNYRKGHVTIDGYNITLENPKGSERSGTDKDGNKWSVTMNNDYGYIRGTEGVDGDHIDVFLSDTPESGRVFVVDQVNEDGSFDEHKVMYGFDTLEDAREAYLANYSPGWNGLGQITEVSKDQFKKWIGSSHRKTKPFAEYKSMITPKKPEEVNGYRKGDKVYYDGKPATIYDFEYDGRPVLDTGLAPVLYTIADWKDVTLDVSPITANFGKTLVNKSGETEIRIGKYDGDKQTVGVKINGEAQSMSVREVIGLLGSDEWSEVKEDKPAEKKSSGMQQVSVEGLFGDLKTKGTAKLSDNVVEESPAYGSQNKVVSTARYEELRKKMREKLNNLNAGYDPELVAIGAEMAAYHVEAGARKFVDFAKRMLGDMGEEIRPYLKLFYNSVRDFPGMESYEAEMTPYEEVRNTDINNIKLTEDEQAETNTEAVVSEAEAVVSEAEAVAATGTAEEIDKKIKDIDASLEKVNSQLALLGYYEADTSTPFHESYGYVKSSEKKALADAKSFAKKLQKDLGVKEEKFSDKRRKLASVNIAPAGGSITLNIPLQQDRVLAIYIPIDIDRGTDDMFIPGGIMYRIESGSDFAGESNMYINEKSDYPTMLNAFRRLAKAYLPQQEDKPVKVPVRNKSSKRPETLSVGDLFTNENDVSLQGETIKQTDNEQERRSETENSGLGKEAQQEDGKPVGDGMDRSSTGSVGSDKVGSGRSSVVSPVDGSGSTAGKRNERNNRNERAVDYAPKSPKARFDANIRAIKLMRELVASDAVATRQQMEVLRKFSGWGGLGTFFNNEDSAEYKKLRELLSDEEFDAAANSINSAYYTPSTVIDTLWDIAGKLGFRGGNILEGSAGIGNIIGSMSVSISENSSIEAVEIDPVTGNILKLLYPDAKVNIQGFEDTRIRNGSVDLAITNVPFVTGLQVHDPIDKDLSRKFRNIHDFCIAKNVRKLREGGIGIFITSSGTMDKSTALREWLVNEGNADFIGAFRLNNKTFEGASVTSDIIVVRKRVGKSVSPAAIDAVNSGIVRTGEYPTGEKVWDKKSRSWVEETKTATMELNNYFQQHPENMAGEMAFNYEKGETRYPGSYALFPAKGKNQNTMLAEWVDTFQPLMEKGFQAQPATEEISTEEKNGALFADEKGNFYVSEMGVGVPLNLNANKVRGYEKTECLKDYNTLKSALDAVLQYQVANQDDAGLKPLIDKLNEAYDTFVSKYGSLNKNTSISFLRNDVDFPSVAAIEDYREYKNAKEEKVVEINKTNVFKGRVIGFQAEPEPKTVKDGVIASIYKFGHIDLDYISDKLKRTPEDVKQTILSEGIGFVNPESGAVEVRYNYLSGNVRQKLQQAKENNENGEYTENIKALEQVMPLDIPAHLINFSLGSSWIDPALYADYIKDRFGVNSVSINHVEGIWNMKTTGYANEKNRSEGVYSEKFGEVIYGTELVEAALNNRTIQVKKVITHSDKTKETVVDKEATQACLNRIQEIKDDFKEWMHNKMLQDEELATNVAKVYNEKFNNLVPMVIDEMFLPAHFGGSSEAINLYTHQKRAVIRGTTEPLLLAHEVGSGKTFTLISTAMEMRRLGTAKKPMIVVQNATVGQFVADAKKLYPNAKVLTITERDRTPEGRRAFYGRIKYSDWDLIIVPQSTFDMIPDSPERQLTFIQEKIDEKQHAIEVMQEIEGDEIQIRQLENELTDLQVEYMQVSEKANEDKQPKKRDRKREEKTKQNIAARVKEQLDRKVDEVQYFDEMGIDAILVDEAHEYKRLGFSTAMTRGVKGIDPAGSKKAAGVYLKTRAVLEQNGWKNVVFATGTPISNTAAEIWTFMRYLMPKNVLKENEIYYFDDFVRNFGSITQSLEFATSGKFKENTRFAAYINKPELIRLWSSVSDTVLTKDIGYVNDKIPRLEKDTHQDIFLPQSDSLISIMNAVRAELERFENMSGKEKRENSHIPLTMYGIAKRAAIDTRLVDANAPDDPLSKTNKAVEETLRSLEETKEYKGTVAIFCDNQRRWDGNKVGFDLFEDIREKLIARGVPANQIIIMKPGMSVNKKQKIFDEVNAGSVRVVIGNTQTLGTGVNIQERLHTLIHMDAPDRPMDYTQRNGRILRQGNMHKVWNKPVRILRFGVEDSLDVTSYQRLKTKAAFIDSIMDGKAALANNQENRTLEEEEEGLFDNPVAILSGSQYALLKNQAEREYRKFLSKKSMYEADQIYVTNKLAKNKQQIETTKGHIEDNRQKLSKARELFPDGNVSTVIIEGSRCSNQQQIDEALKELVNKKVRALEDVARKDAYFRSQTLAFKLKFDGVDAVARVTLTRQEDYDFKLKATRITVRRGVTYDIPAMGIKDYTAPGGYVKSAIDDITQNIATGKAFSDAIDILTTSVTSMEAENELLSERKGKPFEFGKELEAAKEKVDEYTELMKAELAEKEAKYAGRGAESDIDLSEIETEEVEAESAPEDDIRFRVDEGNISSDSLSDYEENMIRFRDVTDKEELEWLNKQKTVKAYRAMQVIDGKLYPPMMAAIKGKLVSPRELGTWEVADERPDIIKFTKKNKEGEEIGYVDLDKGTKDATGKRATITKDVAYNPYWHTSRSPLNDQFKSAWIRPNLVTVEVEIPESELTSGYRAMYSKNSVGETEWKAGSVSSKLAKIGKPRKVILSRWDKPIRIVPESEVALTIKDMLKGTDIEIPENVVTPKLKKELEKLNVKIGAPEKGVKKTEQIEEAIKAGLAVDNSIDITRFRIDESEADVITYIIDSIHAEAAKLNITVTVYTSLEQVPDGAARRAIEKGKRVKGWYQGGNICIYLPNATDMTDIQATLLHEGVAHFGLRKMVGENNMNAFMDAIYAAASPEVRKEIVKLLPRYNYNMREAVEEYLATLAESGIVEPTFWDKVKQLFRAMLENIGFTVEFTDNDLRYILWESRNNLLKSGNPVDVAKETMMRKKLGIGMFGTQSPGDTHFRMDTRAPLVEEYDAAIANSSYRFQEAFQDSMLSLKVLQDLIEKQSGKPMRTFENAYTAENRLSSVNKVDNERYLEDFFKPLLSQIDKLAKMSDRNSVENYIYAKSGLERNEVFLLREADKVLKEKTEELDKRLADKLITQKQYDKELQELKDAREKFIAEGKDYSGLTGLVLKEYEDELDSIEDDALRAKRQKEIEKEYKNHAGKIVSDFEGTIPSAEVDKLWQLIKAANDENLRKQFDSGMISAERYEELRNMMQYYVPLRGWQESIAEDFYDYTRKESPVQKEKAAKGRKSLADNPIANIALSAQNAIILGNRNKMKQRFFNFIINRPNELVTIRDQWYARTLQTVHEQMEPVYPDIKETDDSATIQQKLEDFENEMKQLEEAGLARRKKIPLGVELKMKSGQKPEHMVSVMINGQEYVMYINGNPRAAQALNGKTNPEGEENIFWEYYNKAKRLYGGGLTSNNPDFVAANFVRDSIHSATMQFLNNGLKSASLFVLNTPRAANAVFRGVMGKYKPGNVTDQYSQEFIQYGGETGYTAIHTIEDYKREYEKALNEAKGIKAVAGAGKKGIEAAIKALEVANRIAEDVNRFNAYMSSREAGKTIEESIDAAKNITVNFNKKGSLGKGKGAWAALAWFMNKWILFFNPAVQGLYQVGQTTKKNRKRVAGTLATIAASGFIMPYFNALLVSAFGGDDKDDYFYQTDYTRMNNWLIFTGDRYVKIPLPPFFREIYGMGDILHRMLTNRITPERAAVATMRQLQSAIGFINLIPEGEPSVKEAVSGIMPDIIAPLMDVALNRDFTGRDIAKDTEWTKNLPEYERVYRGVSPVYVEFSRMLNQIGGDDARRSPLFGTFINPAYMEHIITSYTGGIGRTISNITGAAVDVATGETDNIEFRTIPVINRFGSPVTERSIAASVNRVFYDYLDRYEAMKVAEKRYKAFIKEGRSDFRKELEQMKKNGESELIRYFDAKMKVLRKKQNLLKENPDNKDLEKEIIELKSEMVLKAKKILE